MNHELRTLGHGTMLLLEDGKPLVATDAWVIGSNYWRSWWLEKYPTPAEIELVRQAKFIYYTHSHPDHFHYPSLRHLGKRPTLHPTFLGYVVPPFLESAGYPARMLEPWHWYAIGEKVRIASVPIPIDDSVLIVDTPNATIVDVNDATPRKALLRTIRERMFTAGKPLIMLKSYSPASIGKAVEA